MSELLRGPETWSLKRRVAQLTPSQRRAWVEQLSPEILEEIIREEWWWTSRPAQVPPESGEWLIYLYLAGRGAGKTRSGAEWIVDQSLKYPLDASGAATERLIVGEKIADVRNVLFGGPSGVLRVLQRREIPHRYYKSPKPQIVFLDTGVIIHGDGAENGDVGRGFNLADVWCDEVAKWPRPEESWTEGIMPALRASIPGSHPRAFITTTPKPIKTLREWVNANDGSVITISGSTYDNAENLSASSLKALKKKYEGTTIGEQEIYGKLLDEGMGELFVLADLNAARVEEAPELVTIVIGIDPGLTGEGDETGIVVVGADKNGDWYVLADRSILGVGREAAEHCWRVFEEYDADSLIIETNLGRKWMTETFVDVYNKMRNAGEITTSSPSCPMEAIDAKAGKQLRAQPVGMRSQQKRLHLVGEFPKLEDQMIEYDPNGRDSPDRLDALVHACRWLLKREKRKVRIHNPLRSRAAAKQPTPSIGQNDYHLHAI